MVDEPVMFTIRVVTLVQSVNPLDQKKVLDNGLKGERKNGGV